MYCAPFAADFLVEPVLDPFGLFLLRLLLNFLLVRLRFLFHFFHGLGGRLGLHLAFLDYRLFLLLVVARARYRYT